MASVVFKRFVFDLKGFYQNTFVVVELTVLVSKLEALEGHGVSEHFILHILTSIELL